MTDFLNSIDVFKIGVLMHHLENLNHLYFQTIEIYTSQIIILCLIQEKLSKLPLLKYNLPTQKKIKDFPERFIVHLSQELSLHNFQTLTNSNNHYDPNAYIHRCLHIYTSQSPFLQCVQNTLLQGILAFKAVCFITI